MIKQASFKELTGAEVANFASPGSELQNIVAEIQNIVAEIQNIVAEIQNIFVEIQNIVTGN